MQSDERRTRQSICSRNASFANIVVGGRTRVRSTSCHQGFTESGLRRIGVVTRIFIFIRIVQMVTHLRILHSSRGEQTKRIGGERIMGQISYDEK